MIEILFIAAGAGLSFLSGVYLANEKRKTDKNNETFQKKIEELTIENSRKSDELLKLQNKIQELNEKTIDDLSFLMMSIPDKISIGLFCDLEDIGIDFQEREWAKETLMNECMGKVLVKASKNATAKQNLMCYLAVSKLEISIKLLSGSSYVEFYGEYPRDFNRHIIPSEFNPMWKYDMNKFLFNYYPIPPYKDLIQLTKKQLDVGIWRKNVTSLKAFKDGIISVELKFNHCNGPIFSGQKGLSKDTFINVEKLELNLNNEFEIFEIEELKKNEGSNIFTSKIRIRDNKSN